MGELGGVMKAENRTVKEFLSRRVDKYRQYGNGDKVTNFRQCVLIGTTNEREFLRDPTGERRTWPIPLPDGWKIPIEDVIAMRDSIWASALALALDATFQHWTTLEEDNLMFVHKEEFSDLDPWTDMVRDYCSGLKWIKSTADVYVEKIAAADENAGAKLTRQITNRISGILQRLGCDYVTVRDGGSKFKGWRMSDEVRDAAPSDQESVRRHRATTLATVANMGKN